MKKLHWTLTVSLFILPLSLLSAESDRNRSDHAITIQGQGKISTIPDIAILSVEVSHEGADLDPVLVQVRKEMTRVLEVAKAQGIADKDTQTQYFSVRPKYEQDKRGNMRPVGFIVTNRVSLKVHDLKKTGKILSAVVNAGATTVDGPSFDLDNRQAAEREALAAATRDAKDKAQAIAQAAGVQLGDIIAINPQSVNWPIAQPMRGRMMALAAPSAEEPLAEGEQTITAFITITFAIH